MNYIIEVSAPTHHKLNAIRKFGLPITMNADGSISARDEFTSEEKAIAHLEEREIANCEHDGLVATIRPETLLERMDLDKLDELREVNKMYPSTMQTIEKELSEITYIVDLKYGTAWRICDDLNMNMNHMTLLFN